MTIIRMMRRYVWPAPKSCGAGQYAVWHDAVLEHRLLDRTRFEAMRVTVDVELGRDAAQLSPVIALAWAEKLLREAGILPDQLDGAAVWRRPDEVEGVRVTIWETTNEQRTSNVGHGADTGPGETEKEARRAAG